MCLFQPWFPQGICLGVGLLGHMVVLFLVFLSNLHNIKLLEENIGRTLDINQRKILCDPLSRVMEIKANVNK